LTPATGELIPMNPVDYTITQVIFTWNRLSVATGYNLLVALDSDFLAVVDGFPLFIAAATDPVAEIVHGNPGAPIFLPGTTYYWKVAVTLPMASAFSGTRSFTITASQPPANITLSNSSVQENLPVGAVVGVFSTAPDAGDTFTYTLVAGDGSDDNSSFYIDGNILKTNAVFDYDIKNSFNIRVRTTDSGGLYYEEAFIITVVKIEVSRDLPPVAAPGTTFSVKIAFTAPADNFNSVVIHDEAPAGWLVTGNETFCMPIAQSVKQDNDNDIEYTWLGPYDAGQTFTATYLVTVPAGTPEGSYPFTNGSLIYYLGAGEKYQTGIYGDSEILVGYTLVSGKTYQVSAVILPGVTVKLFKGGILESETTSNENGEYELLTAQTGNFTLTAVKAGFREQSKTLEVSSIGEVHGLNFAGEAGLIPNTMNGGYFAACMNKYLFGTGDFAFGGQKFARIMNAYLYGIP